MMCGPGSLVERLTARTKGRRVPWEMVKRMDRDTIIVASSGD